jgi:hypothetical protein
LAVLSACETALGKSLDGEGVQGLTLACAVAGARNQITTLWPVGDASTVEMMDEFYRHFLAGENPGNALRQAQIKLLKRWRSENNLAVALEYGAPFVCTTSDAFKSVPSLDADSREARLRVPLMANGESGYVVTVDRLGKVWLPGALHGNIVLWRPDYQNKTGVDLDLFATGQGQLYLMDNGRLVRRLWGEMHQGRFEGKGEVYLSGEDTRKETWQNGEPVPD